MVRRQCDLGCLRVGAVPGRALPACMTHKSAPAHFEADQKGGDVCRLKGI